MGGSSRGSSKLLSRKQAKKHVLDKVTGIRVIKLARVSKCPNPKCGIAVDELLKDGMFLPVCSACVFKRRNKLSTLKQGMTVEKFLGKPDSNTEIQRSLRSAELALAIEEERKLV